MAFAQNVFYSRQLTNRYYSIYGTVSIPTERLAPKKLEKKEQLQTVRFCTSCQFITPLIIDLMQRIVVQINFSVLACDMSFLTLEFKPYIKISGKTELGFELVTSRVLDGCSTK